MIDRKRDIVFFTHDLANNAAGRVYALWLLARSLGWSTRVIASRGEMWGPLRSTEFSGDCRVVPDDGRAMDALAGLTGTADLVVAVKPHPGSLGRALAVTRITGVPLLADVDDPDLDVILHTNEGFGKLRTMVAKPGRYRTYSKLKRRLRDLPVIVSNPTLQSDYGGLIIPHVRSDPGVGAPHVSARPHIAFVGTNRPHKGVTDLRRAVREAQDVGATLSITDIAPSDPEPWERWLGETSFDEGMRMVADADVVIIPSRAGTPFSNGQLPAKLMDAMMTGRAVVVTDLPNLVWAAGDGALIVPAGDPFAMAQAIRDFSSPELRTKFGTRARARALEVFSVEAARSAFRDRCLSLMDVPGPTAPPEREGF